MRPYKRALQLAPLIKQSSYFLFGPRATGKTSLLRTQLPGVKYFDLLDTDTYDEFLRRPAALGEQIRSSDKVVVIDEIQRLPRLLDEVHRLIESKKVRFLLTGSSARKLKRQQANLLGGRARELQLYPLTWKEISDFDLLRYLNFGGLPLIYRSKSPQEDLRAYVRVYLAEEIKAEALVRNFERFVRFLEVMSTVSGQEINYASIASDAGVPVRTVENHIEVLKDTLMAFELLPFTKTVKRKAVSRSKFYFFDIGVANYLAERIPFREGSTDAGLAFEHFIINEVRAYLSYNRLDKKLSYWRSGTYEVDLIVGKELAIEIKFTKTLKNELFRGLSALKEEGLIRRHLLVGRFKSAGVWQNIEYFPYESFLKRLWDGSLL
ncbi:MAG: ATP-binding protein [Bdellovibrionaceae bacterium]|nr:ATP-binding protein [Pseudobdellovibrionaceae bacterium]